MILTVTVHRHVAPQKVQTTSGVVVVQPGESFTGEVDDAEAAVIRAATGHFAVGDVEPAKPRRGRPPRMAQMGE